MLESMGTLGKHGVGLVSITENIDYSTPHGKNGRPRCWAAWPSSFSEALSTHVKKGIDERARQGFSPGAASPSGISPAGMSRMESASWFVSLSISGGVHVHPEEGRAVRENLHPLRVRDDHPGDIGIVAQR